MRCHTIYFNGTMENYLKLSSDAFYYMEPYLLLIVDSLLDRLKKSGVPGERPNSAHLQAEFSFFT